MARSAPTPPVWSRGRSGKRASLTRFAWLVTSSRPASPRRTRAGSGRRSSSATPRGAPRPPRTSSRGRPRPWPGRQSWWGRCRRGRPGPRKPRTRPGTPPSTGGRRHELGMPRPTTRAASAASTTVSCSRKLVAPRSGWKRPAGTSLGFGHTADSTSTAPRTHSTTRGCARSAPAGRSAGAAPARGRGRGRRHAASPGDPARRRRDGESVRRGGAPAALWDRAPVTRRSWRARSGRRQRRPCGPRSAHLAVVTVAGALPPQRPPAAPPGRAGPQLADHGPGARARRAGGAAGHPERASVGGRAVTGVWTPVVVVADHCTDATADVARAAGVRVLVSEGRPGAAGQGGRPPVDCAGAPAGRARAGPTRWRWWTPIRGWTATSSRGRRRGCVPGAEVVQGRYLASAPPRRGRWSAELAEAHAGLPVGAAPPWPRPPRRGGQAAGQRDGVPHRRAHARCRGTRTAWPRTSSYWFSLLRAGIHPAHEPLAGVRGPMPHGPGRRRRAARPLGGRPGRGRPGADRSGASTRPGASATWCWLRQPVAELVVPPLAMLGARRFVSRRGRPPGRCGRGRRGPAAGGPRSSAAQAGVLVAHVVTALRVAGAPPATWAALAAAPAVVGWKVLVKARTLLRPQAGWVRTPRDTPTVRDLSTAAPRAPSPRG